MVLSRCNRCSLVLAANRRLRQRLSLCHPKPRKRCFEPAGPRRQPWLLACGPRRMAMNVEREADRQGSEALLRDPEFRLGCRKPRRRARRRVFGRASTASETEQARVVPFVLAADPRLPTGRGVPVEVAQPNPERGSEVCGRRSGRVDGGAISCGICAREAEPKRQVTGESGGRSRARRCRASGPSTFRQADPAATPARTGMG